MGLLAKRWARGRSRRICDFGVGMSTEKGSGTGRSSAAGGSSQPRTTRMASGGLARPYAQVVRTMARWSDGTQGADFIFLFFDIQYNLTEGEDILDESESGDDNKSENENKVPGFSLKPGPQRNSSAEFSRSASEDGRTVAVLVEGELRPSRRGAGTIYSGLPRPRCVRGSFL